MLLESASIGVGTNSSGWCTKCLQSIFSILATLLLQSVVLTLCRLVDGARIDGLGGGKGYEAGDEEGNECILMHLDWFLWMDSVCVYVCLGSRPASLSAIKVYSLKGKIWRVGFSPYARRQGKPKTYSVPQPFTFELFSYAIATLLNDCNLDAMTNECTDEKRMLSTVYA